MKLFAIALALSGTPVASVDLPAIVEQARSSLDLVKPDDRPVAIRNFASILIDADRCDEAAKLFSQDSGLDPLLIDTAVHHAVGNFQLSCAAKLGSLVLERSEPSANGDSVRHARIRMFAGAALRAGGDNAAGQVVISKTEAVLTNKAGGIPNWKYRENIQLLWEARLGMLSIYVGTPYYEPTLLQYAKEFAADQKVAWQMQSGMIMRLSAAERMDLAQDIVARMSPTDRVAATKSLDRNRRQDAIFIYGKNGVPHCPGADPNDEVVTPEERAGVMPPPITTSGPMGTIMSIHQRLHLHVLHQRCPDPLR